MSIRHPVLILAPLYASCTAPPPPIEPPAAPPAPSVASASPPPLPATPDADFRAWVVSRKRAPDRLVRWGGDLPRNGGDTVAFEALLCPDRSVDAPALWLIELGDGRRWSVADGARDDCDNPPQSSPAFRTGRPLARLVSGSRSGPEMYEQRVWGVRAGAPVLLARSGSGGTQDETFDYTFDSEHCALRSSVAGDNLLRVSYAGRAPGCGGFGEIPLRDAEHTEDALESRRVWGTTDHTFSVYAEADAAGDVSLTTTVPGVDAPEGPLAGSDHFELWLPYGVPGSPAYAIRLDHGATVVPLHGAEPGPDAEIVDGRLHIRHLGQIEPGSACIGATMRFAATLVFVDGDGSTTRGLTASGPFVRGHPHPFNRVASASWRYRMGEDEGAWTVTAEPPAHRPALERKE